MGSIAGSIATSTMPVLNFKPPTQDELTLIEAFVAGKTRIAVALKIAGGGKTNVMVFAIAKLREHNMHALKGQKLRYKLLSFMKAPRVVLLDRGLTPAECASLNSDANGQYCAALRRYLQEQKIMEDSQKPNDLQLLEPRVVRTKYRLLLSTYINAHELLHGEALMKLFRPFVANLADKARARALGTTKYASYHDTVAMHEVVSFFKLENLIEDCYNVTLNVSERVAVGDKYLLTTADSRLLFGIQLTGRILDLGIQVATHYKVLINGKEFQSIRNEVFSLPSNVSSFASPCTLFSVSFLQVTNKDHKLPFLDFIGQLYIPVIMEWIQPLERLGVEEFHDTDCLEALYIQMRCPNGTILANLDSGQTIMVWKGAHKKAQMELLSGEDASSNHEAKQLLIRGEENYRSSIAVNRAAQVSRAKIPLSDGLPPLTIKQVRSTPGVFIESGARFTTFPLDLTGTNLIVTRKVHHAVLMLQTLTSMLIPSVMLGRPSVGHMLTSVMHDLHGSLQGRYGQLCAMKAMSAPSDVGDDRYDVVCALIELLPE